jgi:hypothetical protein|tara:strand:+ start:15233 stop:15403 length:171 start_codon:yes stop_codon:yes gene_type:complete
MLFSNPLSKPEIKVPIRVTVRIPIIILRPVKNDRILLDRIESTAILTLSKNKGNIK